MFSGSQADYYGRGHNSALSDISSSLESIYRYSTPLLAGISPQGIFSGLHPGNGMALSVLRQMTPFGSPIDLSKATDISLYTTAYATGHRAQAREYLSALTDPASNLIMFDIETTGTKTILEEYSRPKGQKWAKPTEFSVRSTAGYESYGFTRYAKPGVFKQLASGSEYAEEFALASQRLASYAGPRYKATDIVSQLAEAIVPGRKNIIAGHNIGGFDLKVLSAQYAMEKGYVSRQQLRNFHIAGKTWSSTQRKEAQDIVNAGWQKASNEIMATFRNKDANIRIIDTMGRFKTGTFVTPAEDTGGLVQSLIRGYLPGVRQTWQDVIMGKGETLEKAFETSQYAAAKGSALSSFMGFLGVPFEGKAHDPAADTRANLAFVQSKELQQFVSRGEQDIATQNRASLFKSLSGFLNMQKAEQADVIRRGTPRPEKLKLAQVMSGTDFSSRTPRGQVGNFFRELGEGFMRAPKGVRWGAYGLGALTGIGIIRGMFPSDEYRKMDGLHPGNKGYATSTIRGMTDFGSGWRGLIGISPQIASMLTAQFSNSAGFVINPGKPTVDMGSGPLSSLQSMVRSGMELSKDPAAITAGNRFIKDIDDALAAGYSTPEVAFIKTGLEGQSVRNIIRHERQHVYSNVTGGKAAKAMQKSTIAGARRVFLQGRGVGSVKDYGEEYLGYMAGFRRLGPHQIASELQGLPGPIKGQVLRDLHALAPRIEHTRKSAQFSWLTQRRTPFGASDSYIAKRNTLVAMKMNSPETIARHAISRLQQSTSEALKSRPTAGLIGVLSKLAKGATKYMGKTGIR